MIILLDSSFRQLKNKWCTDEIRWWKNKNTSQIFRIQTGFEGLSFGSYVRGEASPESDIDILVDLDYSKKIGLQFIQMKLDLEKLLMTKVDLVSSNGLSEYIKPLVDHEKRLIYAR